MAVAPKVPSSPSSKKNPLSVQFLFTVMGTEPKGHSSFTKMLNAMEDIDTPETRHPDGGEYKEPQGCFIIAIVLLLAFVTFILFKVCTDPYQSNASTYENYHHPKPNERPTIRTIQSWLNSHRD